MQRKLDRLGWSLTYFGERIGVPARTVSDWVNGRRHGNAAKVADAYLDFACHVMGV